MSDSLSGRPSSTGWRVGAAWSSRLGGTERHPRRLADIDLSDRAFALGTGAAAALALCVAGVALTREPLWLDELLTLGLAGQPAGLFVEFLPERQNGILFDLALWPIVQLGGTSAFWVRLPSLLAFGAAVATTSFVGARLAGRTAGLVAALLLALHPFAVSYGQEARPYAFVLLFTVLAALTLLRALERPSAGRWLAYGLSVVGLVFSHDLALLALLAHPILLIGRSRRRWLQWTAILVVVAPAIGLLLALVPDDLGREALRWLLPPSLGDVLRMGAELGGGKLVASVSLALLAVGGIVALRARPHGPPLRYLAFVAVGCVAPFVVLALISVVRPILVPRYAIAGLPALCLALGIAATLLRPRLALLLSGLTALVFLGATVHQHVALTKEDWPGVAAYLQANRLSPEPILVAGELSSNVDGLLYYMPSFGVARDDLFFSLRGEGASALPAEIVPLDRDAGLQLARAGEHSFWLVSQGYVSPRVQSKLDAFLARCALRSERSFRAGLRVEYVGRCTL